MTDTKIFEKRKIDPLRQKIILTNIAFYLKKWHNDKVYHLMYKDLLYTLKQCGCDLNGIKCADTYDYDTLDKRLEYYKQVL